MQCDLTDTPHRGNTDIGARQKPMHTYNHVLPELVEEFVPVGDSLGHYSPIDVVYDGVVVGAAYHHLG